MARTDTLGHFLTDIADAIRTKGGTSADIQASSFDTAIANLPSGGGTIEVEEKDVNFYDYDGKRLYAYTKTEFLALSSLPSTPTHDGLTSQGWSWTLADAQTSVAELGELDIGHYVITSDGATRIYFSFTDEHRLSPYLCFAVNGTVTIDWGDNTTSTATGTDLTTLIKTQHTYATTGDYVISISGDEICFITTSSGSPQSMIFTMNNTSTPYENIYTNAIYRIELGSNVTTLDSYGFARLHSLKVLTTSKNITSVKQQALVYCSFLEFYLYPSVATAASSSFYECRALKRALFSKTTTSTSSSLFNYCYSLEKITTYNIALKSSAFANCYNLKKVVCNNTETLLQSSLFNNCRSLAYYKVESTTTRVRGAVFAGCLSLKLVDFTSLSAVPTLDNVNAFSDIPDDYIILVPDDLYNSWITTNNWSSLTSHIVKESDYNN